jgi:hypothetical protein
MANASPLLETPFDDHSTAEEVLADVDLSGRRAIVTGLLRASGQRPRVCLPCGAQRSRSPHET